MRRSAFSACATCALAIGAGFVGTDYAMSDERSPFQLLGTATSAGAAGESSSRQVTPVGWGWGGYYRPYGSYYGGYGSYYGSYYRPYSAYYRPYSTYYRGYSGYRPYYGNYYGYRPYYGSYGYRPYYGGYYGGYYGYRPGISIWWGF
jgi:hypothetical protein